MHLQAELTRPKVRYWTVTEITQKIKGTLEPAFNEVWIQGEISNYRPASSGHVYFSLKDSGAVLSAALFGWGRRSSSFDLKDGLEVICRGKLSVYPPRGSYQLVVDRIEPLGTGALQLAFEQLKTKLMAEGLFDSQKKRPLPAFPRRVVVITSPTGAVVRDILNVLQRRAPHLSILIIPVLVQGDEAPAQLIRAIEVANETKAGDVILLARGGGSVEDLWCFNHEGLARQISLSKIPVVSAVGHETDFTIADFVADLRAPTPSAGAELISAQWLEIQTKIQEMQIRLTQAVRKDFLAWKTLVTHISARVVNPGDRLREQSQQCDDLYLRLGRALAYRVELKKSLLQREMSQLHALSPLNVLERGYAIVKEAGKNQVIKSVQQVLRGNRLEITFYDGRTNVQAV